MEWRLSDARNRLGEVVRRALSEGPQRVTRRGEAVIVIAEAEYRRLIGEKPAFLTYLAEGPSLADVPLERSRTPIRDVEL